MIVTIIIVQIFSTALMVTIINNINYHDSNYENQGFIDDLEYTTTLIDFSILAIILL